MPLEMLSARTISIRGNMLYRFIQISKLYAFLHLADKLGDKIEEFRYVGAADPAEFE